jgi:hypothetical protein
MLNANSGSVRGLGAAAQAALYIAMGLSSCGMLVLIGFRLSMAFIAP